MEIVTAAAGIINEAMAKPATDAALRWEAVIRAPNAWADTAGPSNAP
ncbi:hypothetical protein ACWEQ2_39950 [Streptomyces sp. NPDC004096]